MAFIVLGPPDLHTRGASESDPGINVDNEPFGLRVQSTAQELVDQLSNLGPGGILSVALQGRDELVHVNAAAILYVTD